MGGATRGQAHKFDPTTTGELTRYGRVDQGGTGGGGGGAAKARRSSIPNGPSRVDGPGGLTRPDWRLRVGSRGADCGGRVNPDEMASRLPSRARSE